jgi:hypothetical protein
MVFYVFALQCASTVAVVRRENEFLEVAVVSMDLYGTPRVGSGFRDLSRRRLLGWQ